MGTPLREASPAAGHPLVVYLPPGSWALSRRARNRAAHAAHGNGPKGKARDPPNPAAPAVLCLRQEDWPVPIRDGAWPGGADGVLFLGDSLPTAEQLAALAQSPHRIFLVSLQRPPSVPAAASLTSVPPPSSQSPSAPVPTPAPRPLNLPLQGARLLVRKAYAFCSPAAASVPLTGDPPVGSDHPMPDASANNPTLGRARDLLATADDAVLLALELEERCLPAACPKAALCAGWGPSGPHR